jgi:hypothetical protein
MKPRHVAGAFHSAEEQALLTDLRAPGRGDLHSDDHFRSANNVLLLSRQQAVDRQLRKDVFCEAVCEHECLGAAVRAARQDAERPPLLVGQLSHCTPIGLSPAAAAPALYLPSATNARKFDPTPLDKIPAPGCDFPEPGNPRLEPGAKDGPTRPRITSPSVGSVNWDLSPSGMNLAPE